MPIADLLMSGLSLMVVGMGIVFIFLLVLVFAMKGMSRLAMCLLERQGVGEGLSYPPAPVGQATAGVRGDLIAVIAAAVARYRANPG